MIHGGLWFNFDPENSGLTSFFLGPLAKSHGLHQLRLALGKPQVLN